MSAFLDIPSFHHTRIYLRIRGCALDLILSMETPRRLFLSFFLKLNSIRLDLPLAYPYPLFTSHGINLLSLFAILHLHLHLLQPSSIV